MTLSNLLKNRRLMLTLSSIMPRKDLERLRTFSESLKTRSMQTSVLTMRSFKRSYLVLLVTLTQRTLS